VTAIDDRDRGLDQRVDVDADMEVSVMTVIVSTCSAPIEVVY
jgi:hypothetical protein